MTLKMEQGLLQGKMSESKEVAHFARVVQPFVESSSTACRSPKNPRDIVGECKESHGMIYSLWERVPKDPWNNRYLQKRLVLGIACLVGAFLGHFYFLQVLNLKCGGTWQDFSLDPYLALKCFEFNIADYFAGFAPILILIALLYALGYITVLHSIFHLGAPNVIRRRWFLLLIPLSGYFAIFSVYWVLDLLSWSLLLTIDYADNLATGKISHYTFDIFNVVLIISILVFIVEIMWFKLHRKRMEPEGIIELH